MEAKQKCTNRTSPRLCWKSKSESAKARSGNLRVDLPGFNIVFGGPAADRGKHSLLEIPIASTNSERVLLEGLSSSHVMKKMFQNPASCFSRFLLVNLSLSLSGVAPCRLTETP